MSILTLDWEQSPPDAFRAGAVAIGNFDGVHRGHASLISELRHRAVAVGGPAVAVTLDPHPLQLLRPEQFQPVLTTAADRAALLQTCGADHVLLLRTTCDLLELTAADFFQRVLRDRLGVRSIVEGPNFGFGRNREGNLSTLAQLCGAAGVNLVVVPPVMAESKPISSSRVRNALVRGAVREAAAFMNRPYSLRGTVVQGQQRGRTLGFPTANLGQIETLIPGDGVYAVRAFVDSRSWPAAANIGPNPTFGERARKVEVHLMGFQGDLLNQPLAIDFLERLRDTRPFGSVSELVEQLKCDIEQARRILAAEPTAQVRRVLAEEIAPGQQMDGGHIELIDLNCGVARVRLTGTCSACPSAVMAIVMGIEQELRRRFPAIDYVQAVP
jgi:riboflavin kinase / FMN adenylyltransferase